MTLPLLARGGCRPQLARQTLLRSLRAALCLLALGTLPARTSGRTTRWTLRPNFGPRPQVQFDAEVAKRKAGEPLKPKVGQKPANEGLFGDEANETDLIDLTGRPAATKPATGAIAKDHFFSITRERHSKDRAML